MDDDRTMDFTTPGFVEERRFQTEEQMRASLWKISRPTACLLISDIPHDSCVPRVLELLISFGLKQKDAMAFAKSSRKTKTTEQAADSQTQRRFIRLYVEMEDAGEAMKALTLLSGLEVTSESGTGRLGVAFAQTSVPKERQKASSLAAKLESTVSIVYGKCSDEEREHETEKDEASTAIEEENVTTENERRREEHPDNDGQAEEQTKRGDVGNSVS